MAQDFLTGGYGVTQNVTRAMELLSLAARSGSVDAKVLLGKLIAGASLPGLEAKHEANHDMHVSSSSSWLPGLEAKTHAQGSGKGEEGGGTKS